MLVVGFTCKTINLMLLLKKRAHLMKCFCIYMHTLTLAVMCKSSKYKKQKLAQLSIYNVWEYNHWQSKKRQIFLILRAQVIKKKFSRHIFCFKDKYSLLYRTDPQSLLVLWPCYAITYVRRGISFEEMWVSLDCCIIGLWPPINKNICL